MKAMHLIADRAASFRPNRRQVLRGAGASLALWGLRPGRALAATGDPRLLVVVLRGGLDGLSAIAPVGDPDYQRLRGALAIPTDGPKAGRRLDALFALNPRMAFLGGLFAKGEALAVHAAASPYRGRSHFDGQDVLESGLAGVGRVDDGWLNRALAGLRGDRVSVPRKGLAMGAVVPLVMRGPAPVLSWIPDTSRQPLHVSTVGRLTDLYAATDARLAKAFAEGIAIERVGQAGGGLVAGQGAAGIGSGAAGQPQPQPFRDLVETARTAAGFLAAPDGPRIGALSINGWDTHANEGVLEGQLGNRLAGLDLALETLHSGLGPAWKETVVAVITEFGRTAHPNGTAGTDHGTATVALALGGAVKGGRVIADWPGLAEPALYEGRDLRPTTDLRSLLKGLLRDHLGLSEAVLASTVFPGSADVRPIDGLLA
jgi:uncharacterized protein (DUF1501 family)